MMHGIIALLAILSACGVVYAHNKGWNNWKSSFTEDEWNYGED